MWKMSKFTKNAKPAIDTRRDKPFLQRDGENKDKKENTGGERGLSAFSGCGAGGGGRSPGLNAGSPFGVGYTDANAHDLYIQGGTPTGMGYNGTGYRFGSPLGGKGGSRIGSRSGSKTGGVIHRGDAAGQYMDRLEENFDPSLYLTTTNYQENGYDFMNEGNTQQNGFNYLTDFLTGTDNQQNDFNYLPDTQGNNFDYQFETTTHENNNYLPDTHVQETSYNYQIGSNTEQNGNIGGGDIEIKPYNDFQVEGIRPPHYPLDFEGKYEDVESRHVGFEDNMASPLFGTSKIKTPVVYDFNPNTLSPLNFDDKPVGNLTQDYGAGQDFAPNVALSPMTETKLAPLKEPTMHKMVPFKSPVAFDVNFDGHDQMPAGSNFQDQPLTQDNKAFPMKKEKKVKHYNKPIGKYNNDRSIAQDDKTVKFKHSANKENRSFPHRHDHSVPHDDKPVGSHRQNQPFPMKREKTVTLSKGGDPGIYQDNKAFPSKYGTRVPQSNNQVPYSFDHQLNQDNKPFSYNHNHNSYDDKPVSFNKNNKPAASFFVAM